MTETSTITATHPVVDGDRDLYIIMQVAELRDLPLPFVARVYDYDSPVELQFHSRDDVAAWAEVLNAEVVDNFYNQASAPNHVTGVRAEWMDIQLVLVASAAPKAVA